MTRRDTEGSNNNQVSEAIAEAIRISAAATRLTSEVLQSASDNVTSTTTAVREAVGPEILRLLEQGTENIGKIVTPIAENPLVRFAGRVPGINLLLTALGQVDTQKAQNDVDKLRREHPLDTSEQLANRIIVDTCLKAGGIGLVTNFLPPLALALFAVDIAAVTTLQAEMVYRIAAAYGFSLKDSARRGEVLAIFALSLGGSGVLKVGLGVVELIPVIGAVVGASSNAGLIYSLGYFASQFYEAKKNSAPTDLMI